MLELKLQHVTNISRILNEEIHKCEDRTEQLN